MPAANAQLYHFITDRYSETDSFMSFGTEDGRKPALLFEPSWLVFFLFQTVVESSNEQQPCTKADDFGWRTFELDPIQYI